MKWLKSKIHEQVGLTRAERHRHVFKNIKIWKYRDALPPAVTGCMAGPQQAAHFILKKGASGTCDLSLFMTFTIIRSAFYTIKIIVQEKRGYGMNL